MDIQDPLMKEYERCLRAADGYIDLGMWQEVNAALEDIDGELRATIPVLLTRQKIYRALDLRGLWEVVTHALGTMGVRR